MPAGLHMRLLPLFVAVFLQNFVLWYAIEKLFLKSLGFSDVAIAIETVIFMGVALVCNIPAGILADRWSRKGVLMVSSFFLALASLLCGLSNSIVGYIVGISIWGLFTACYSGLYDSIIYDTLLEETGSGKKFAHFYGRLEFISTVALVSSALLSGIIGDSINYRAGYLLSVPVALASIIPLALFKEPTLHKKNKISSWTKSLGEIMSFVLQKRQLLWLILNLIIVVTCMRLLLEFGPLWLVALSMPVLLFGPAIAFIQISIGFGGFFAGKIINHGKIILGISVFIVLCAPLLAARILPVSLIVLVFLLTCLMILRIILNQHLHDALPSRIRAGVASTIETITYCLFLPTALGFGFISSKQSIFEASWLITVLLTVCFIGMLKIQQQLLSPRNSVKGHDNLM